MNWSSTKLNKYLPSAAFIISAALVLALTSGLTVNAAFYSLPGEPLYRLKIVFERTQLAMVGDSARKVELKVEFARNRVKELEKLVANVTSGCCASPGNDAR